MAASGPHGCQVYFVFHELCGRCGHANVPDSSHDTSIHVRVAVLLCMPDTRACVPYMCVCIIIPTNRILE